MKQRSPNSEEALPAVDDALAVPPGLFKKPAHKAQGFYLVLTNLLDSSIRRQDVIARSASTAALNSSTTRHQIDDEHNQRNDQQQVNEVPRETSNCSN
jgi:hypothetical protein